MSSLNLARRPFRNDRPVRRVALALWFLGALLLGINAILYWRYITGQDRQRQDLVELEAVVDRERGELEENLANLEEIDLDWQNDQVRFLNYKIAERSLSWGVLFDQLAEVLPEKVRLERVSPQLGSLRMGEVLGGATNDNVVRLGLSLSAEDDEQILILIDRLYEHPSFQRPNLSVESHSADGVSFNLSVQYQPEAIGAQDGMAAEEGEGAAESAQASDLTSAEAAG